jgi:phosphomevalonate kinase
MLGDKVVFKAPGKVLMTGGYGVLEEGNVGLTLAVDKYFYSVSSSVLS